MQMAKDRLTLWHSTRNWRRDGETIALVPTMGNLHEGHIALVRKAKTLSDRVITSIYVNPTQFRVGEDLDSYPRTPDADIKALDEAQCDLVFMPGVETMYPHSLSSAFMLHAPEELASVLEGEFRPGHFDGVATVVCRLFNLVKPDVAVFGEKDFQQLLIIRRMVEDLGYDIAIEGLATVRDETGLALSSRNRYLDSDQKAAARNLSRVLRTVADRISQGMVDFHQLEQEAAQQLKEFGLKADYVSVRRETDLKLPAPEDHELRVIAAAWCGPTRLIDNISSHIACNQCN
jgi:pantoate--beta-alanine ligase